MGKIFVEIASESVFPSGTVSLENPLLFSALLSYWGLGKLCFGCFGKAMEFYQTFS